MFKRIITVIVFCIAFGVSVKADVIERYRAFGDKGENGVYFDIYNYNGTNYFSLRDGAALLKDSDKSFNVGYDSVNNIAIVTKNDRYTPSGAEFVKSIGKKKSEKNAGVFRVNEGGNEYSFTSYNINGINYISLRDICTLAGVDAKWEPDTKKITLYYINDKGEDVNLCTISVLPPVIVDKYKPMVALTFDDGPSKNTVRILDTLKKYNGVATFFVTENNALKYGDILKRIVNEESQIGNHTAEHKRLTELSADEVKLQVQRIQEIVKSATGVCPNVTRPPYGSYNDNVKNSVGMRIVTWNVDTLDWKTRNAENTYNEVINTLADGNIILMHDLYSETADAVDRIVPEIVKRGYQLVTVDQLIYAKDGNVKGLVK